MFGKQFHADYARYKRAEWDEFYIVVGDWEVEKYLRLGCEPKGEGMIDHARHAGRHQEPCPAHRRRADAGRRPPRL